MSPSTAEAPAATAADARRRQRPARHHGAAAEAAFPDAAFPDNTAHFPNDAAQPSQGGPASGPHPAAPSSAPWPDSVANPRRTRVR